MADEELWCVWEMLGDTAGATRGEMAHRIRTYATRGWELAKDLSTIGSDGFWPHAMALWRIPSREALTDQLNVGLGDGFEEQALKSFTSRLYRRISGGLDDRHDAFLIEHVRCETAEGLAALAGADMVLAELFAPWQGLVVWGAADLQALAERESHGIGVSDRAGLLEVLGWWAVVPQRLSV